MSSLTVVMYHYVRDLARTVYSRLKAMPLDDFRDQVDALGHRYEMATLESALAFLRGDYVPTRALCLLTFDDGVKEHYTEVTPLLAERGIEGQFFVITGCLEDGVVAPVHMNHFLMAKLEFEEYSRAFLARLDEGPKAADGSAACSTYPWDTPEVAAFKYFFNFRLNPEVRDSVVAGLFEEHIGPQREFSRELYCSWEESRQMQAAGMVMGGHSHRHRPLSALSESELEAELRACRAVLDCRLAAQPLWPFCYPYGKQSSFSEGAMAEIDRLGFACAYTTEAGVNDSGAHPFLIRRIDCKKVGMYRTAA